MLLLCSTVLTEALHRENAAANSFRFCFLTECFNNEVLKIEAWFTLGLCQTYLCLLNFAELTSNSYAERMHQNLNRRRCAVRTRQVNARFRPCFK